MSNGSSKAMVSGLRLAKILVWVVYAYLIAAVIILVLAFFLQLFAANPDAEFTQWVYRAADRALSPFRGIFPSVEGESGSVLDFAVVFAIIMYGILALVVQTLVEWLDSRIYAARRRRPQQGTAQPLAPPQPVTPAPMPASTAGHAPPPPPQTAPAVPPAPAQTTPAPAAQPTPQPPDPGQGGAV